MTVYLDTSNLVKLYVNEPDSDAVADLVHKADIVVTSVLAYAEARATFARQRRERRLTAAECSAVVRQFDDDWHRFVVITFGDELALAQAGSQIDTAFAAAMPCIGVVRRFALAV